MVAEDSVRQLPPNSTTVSNDCFFIQAAEDYDNHFVEDITLRLFDEAEPTMDLVAINIQRGREHGLPEYIKYRKACGTSGGGRIKSFSDLSGNISPKVRILMFRAVGSDQILAGY